MNLDYAIKKYESKLAYYELLPNSYPSVAADVRQLIEWLKDYKRLLEEEKNWRKSIEAEIVKKDEEIKALKAELDKPITWGDFTRSVCFSGLLDINQAVADWEKRRAKRG